MIPHWGWLQFDTATGYVSICTVVDDNTSEEAQHSPMGPEVEDMHMYICTWLTISRHRYISMMKGWDTRTCAYCRARGDKKKRRREREERG
jgi:hypothetical protein